MVTAIRKLYLGIALLMISITAKDYPISVGQVWQHYKGKKYEVIAIGHHSETEEKVVVYKGLYSDPVFGENPVCVRPIGMFFETVEYNGKTTPRFTQLP